MTNAGRTQRFDQMISKHVAGGNMSNTDIIWLNELKDIVMTSIDMLWLCLETPAWRSEDGQGVVNTEDGGRGQLMHDVKIEGSDPQYMFGALTSCNIFSLRGQESNNWLPLRLPTNRPVGNYQDKIGDRLASKGAWQKIRIQVRKGWRWSTIVGDGDVLSTPQIMKDMLCRLPVSHCLTSIEFGELRNRIWNIRSSQDRNPLKAAGEVLIRYVLDLLNLVSGAVRESHLLW